MEIVLDEGFQFGLGAFETIAVEQGKPLLLKRHLKRLERAAAFLGMENPKERGISEESATQYLREQKETHPGELWHGALKLVLSEKNALFQIRPSHYIPKMYEQGFTMDFSQVRRNETSPLVYHKTLNYGDCILEKRAAAARGMQECIFLNTRGEIAEGAVSNIFFIENGQIRTPKLSCGLLPGIMREYLLDTEEVQECVIKPEDLKHFEECFVTNSLMGIMPVRKLGEICFPQSEQTRALREKAMMKIMSEE